MTKSEVEAILARAEKATPGPWESLPPEPDDDGFVIQPIQSKETLGLVGEIYGGDRFSEPKANAQFVAHARTDLPELAQAYMRLQEQARLYHDGQNCPWCYDDGLCPLGDLLTAYHDGTEQVLPSNPPETGTNAQ